MRQSDLGRTHPMSVGAPNKIYGESYQEMNEFGTDSASLTLGRVGSSILGTI